MKRLLIYVVLLLPVTANVVKAQSLNPDSAVLALRDLKTIQAQLVQQPTVKGPAQIALISNMLKLGVWDKALQLINAGNLSSADYKLLRADYLILNNDFKNAELLVNSVLATKGTNEKAIRLKAYLQIQAWRLPQAIATCKKSLARNHNQEETELLMGRALLLQKKYPQALDIAKKLEAKNAQNAGAYLLEADVYFWNQHADQAEAPLKKSLAIDPYNADARFSYGYAIWRRIDATQLNAMAAQWEIALAVNPLHFSTNWHWGNGHTNLTYADYAEKNDEEVRKALAPADSLFSANKINEAIAFTHVIQKKYPNSVLPLMHRGSLYYSAFDTNRKLRLDSAEKIFRQILARKKHYGPAHNGLAAVIKSKRIPYLYLYDSVTHVLNTLKIADEKNFLKVFPDVSYYPGHLAKAMVYNQLYAAKVYFPFLAKEGNAFRVSPLHIDLAITMKSPSFRYSTTFDNRQWMDIRGVGSGAADIEYVERGAYEERNVILHEYTHLYDGRVFTDEETRAVRAHYYKAMAEHRTLDYYSQNNESEYLAQTYPAYFEPVKVHPLDFKSMNTRADLIAKDPGMYEFIDKLVKRQRAYLAGDKSAMASNWAEVYLNLSNRSARRKDSTKTAAYLDTALTYDSKYLPVYLAYSHLKTKRKDFASAAQWLQKAEAVNPNYAPIYVAHADLAEAQYNAGLIDQPTAVSQQADYLNKAAKIEDDYMEQAGINRQLREMYRDNGLIAEAIDAAAYYAKNGASVSTYLRDQRDDAAAFVDVNKSELGYPEPIAELQHLVEQKPQNFEFRSMYAEALAANKQYPKAIETLQQAQRILKAGGEGSAWFNLQIATYYNELGQKDSVTKYLPVATKFKNSKDENGLYYIRLLNATGKAAEATEILKAFPLTGSQAYLSDYAYTQGKILEAAQPELAAVSYEKAIKYNPYIFKVYPWLITYYNKNGQAVKADALKNNLKLLKIQPGSSLSMM
ncbi:hypothetical protein [Mucilaginibacter jinjuensis]|uniref:Tetratricopeptide repeat protein n=1 Tax=Mucilaginibacter jinjuensis TaxID=1176721 RepID=A0ABY7T5X2_9SPHI|nr:hypothetical protein [Mucilaginibacter jinjuensis]WCT11741.1 hypothetical protein PQO05_23710 [Mucilaginibacter jinjuensis]